MTVVLPAPVASLRARRESSPLASPLARARWSSRRRPAAPDWGYHLGQPDRGLDRLDLAEKWANAAELMAPPVLYQPRGLRRHSPQAGIGLCAPLIDIAAHLIDDRGRVILLLFCRQSLAFVEDQFVLADRVLALLRLGYWRDELGAAALVNDLLSWLAVLVEFPMTPGSRIGRVQNGLIEKGIGHPAPTMPSHVPGWVGQPRSLLDNPAADATGSTTAQG